MSDIAVTLPPQMPPSPLLAPPRSWLGRVMLDTIRRTGARIGLVWIIVVAFCAVFAPLLASSYPYLVQMGGRWSSPLLRHLTPTDVLLLVLAAAAVFLWMCRLSFGQRVAMLLWVLALALPLAFAGQVGRWLAEFPRRWDATPDHIWTIAAIILLAIGALLDLALIVGIPAVSSAPRRVKVSLAILAAALAAIVIQWPVLPPQTNIYSEYREAQQQGQVQWVLNAPIAFSPGDRLRDQFDPSRPQPWAPAGPHFLGTDTNGEDILANMIHACRIAMSIGFISTGISLLIGILVGGLMGYFVGWVDLLGMRLVEIIGSIPTIYLLLTFVAYYPRNIYLIMAIIGLTSWVGDARFVRAEFLKLRNLDFVHAARAAGLPLRSILFRHLLPNALAPLLVSASFGVASAIIAESTLSFLGLGLVDEASWGRLLDMARSAGRFYWWLALYPGLAIFLTVLSYNFIGEAFRDALDPRLHRTE